MSEVKKIAKNSLWLITGEGISKIAIFFLVFILARKISVADFGKYNLAFSFVMIFSVMNDMGLNIFLFREVARNRDFLSKYLSNILVMRIILSVIFFATVSIFAAILKYSSELIKLIYLFAVWSSFTSLTYVFRTSFKAMEIMKWDALLNILDNFSRVLFTILFLALGMGVYSVGVAYPLSIFIIFFIALLIFTKYFAKLNFDFDFSLWKFALKEMRFLSITAILIPIFGKFDSVIINYFNGAEAVGIYGASLKLVWMLIMGPGFITQSVFPRLSQSAFHDEEKFRSTVSYLFKTNFLLGFLASLAIFLLANPIIYFIYGVKYLSSVRVLQVLIWCFLLQGVNGVFIYGLNARNKQKINAIFIGSAILLNILLSITLAPIFGYMGVASATLGSIIILFVLFISYYIKNYHINLKELRFTKKDLLIVKKVFLKKERLG